jgi:hypothetical protein
MKHSASGAYAVLAAAFAQPLAADDIREDAIRFPYAPEETATA